MKTSENVHIRKGIESDVTAVHQLIYELADYEKAAHKMKISAEDIREGGFGETAIFEFIVAEVKGEIIGMALFYPRFSTWKGRTLYLEDLIVTEKFRRKGIGKLLMEELINICKNQKVALMHWEVLDWNTPAIDFYKKYNAVFDGEWVNVKLEF